MTDIDPKAIRTGDTITATVTGVVQTSGLPGSRILMLRPGGKGHSVAVYADEVTGHVPAAPEWPGPDRCGWVRVGDDDAELLGYTYASCGERLFKPMHHWPVPWADVVTWTEAARPAPSRLPEPASWKDVKALWTSGDGHVERGESYTVESLRFSDLGDIWVVSIAGLPGAYPLNMFRAASEEG